MKTTRTIWLWRGAIVVAFIALWEIISLQSSVSRFFVGSPPAVASTIVTWFVSGTIYKHLGVTLLETLLSFAIGAGLAIVVGLALALNETASAIFDPFLKALNTMPRLILAPIFGVWFGLGIWSKVALAVTLVFFIVFFNVYQGIRDVSPVLLANVRMLGASRAQLIRRLYLPSAMTWVFSSLHLSLGMAFVGAVIGEYLGAGAGVGYLIAQAEATFEIDTVLAGVATLTACALLLDYGITLVETRILRWK